MDYKILYYYASQASVVRIIYELTKVLEYKPEPIQTMTIYLSNIGGLLSLWFGLSFIDTSIFIRSSINIIIILSMILRNKIHEILIIRHVFDCLKFSFALVKNLNTFITVMASLKNFNWKLLLIVLTFPLLLFQVYQLSENYLQFTTKVNVEIVKYRNLENKLGYDVIPAITVCEPNYGLLGSGVSYKTYFEKYAPLFEKCTLHHSKSTDLYERCESIMPNITHFASSSGVCTTYFWNEDLL